MKEEYVTSLQFTELYDKNGKEIYHGDIVKKEGYKPVDVEFVGGAEPWSFLSYYENSEDFEILGNIYENPELLNS